MIKCFDFYKRKENENRFLQIARDIHNNKYNYSEFVYYNAHTKGIIICEKHGEFKKSPTKHINSKQGCPVCGRERMAEKCRLNIENFIEKAVKVHGNIYDYSKVEFKNSKNSQNKIIIICEEHGSFEQLAASHLQNHGCPNCGGSKKLDLEKFIDKAKDIHNNEYDYSKFVYCNAHTKGIIICEKHGEFKQSPGKHTNGKQGCPNCKHSVSKIEQEWLDHLNIDKKYRNNIIKIAGKIFKPDAIINKTIYEFYGDFWHGNPNRYKSNDINPSTKTTYGELYNKTIGKEKLLINAGYELITIWESDWNLIKQKNIIL